MGDDKKPLKLNVTPRIRLDFRGGIAIIPCSASIELENVKGQYPDHATSIVPMAVRNSLSLSPRVT